VLVTVARTLSAKHKRRRRKTRQW